MSEPDNNKKAPRWSDRGAKEDGEPWKNDIDEGNYSANTPESKPPIIRLPFPENIRDAVHEYLGLGMVPIPLNRFDEGSENEKGKKPKQKGYRDATAAGITPDFLEKFWGGQKPCNIALVLQGHHIVIDLDSKQDGGQSAENWLKDRSELAEIPRERTSGGFHLHLRCPDLPRFTNKVGKPLGKALVSPLGEGLVAELMFSGLPVTVAPSIHKSGALYRWEQGGEIPQIEWKRLKDIFGFCEPHLGEELPSGTANVESWRSVQRKFRGDLDTLGVISLFKRCHSYGEVVDADEGKHSVRCPFSDEHSDQGENWTSADTSAVIYEGRGKKPVFHCLHAHCDGRSIGDVLLKIESSHPGLVDECCATRVRPQIELPRLGRSESSFAVEVADVLAETGEDFIFGGQVVVVRATREKLQNSVKLHPLEPKEAVTSFEKHIEFVKSVETSKGQFELVPYSMTKPEILLASYPLAEKLPIIERLLPLPVPLFDGAKIVLPKTGYDKRFHTYVDPNAPRPTEMSLTEALDVLNDLLGNDDGRGFAWKDEESKIAATSRLLTPYCRGLMDWKKAPVFLIMANQPRVGKDTVAYVSIVLYTGVEPTAPPLGRENDDEMRKRITSALRCGSRFLHFPNMKGKIDFPSLEAATDASCFWRDRLLGGNKEVILPNEAEYSLSANIGSEWSLDLDGRAVIIRLHYGGEDVNRREFRHPDILGHVRRNRPQILGTLDALVRHWDKMGRPAGPTPHASFPEWGKIVGGIMHAAGLGDPCLRASDLQGVTGDSETEDMRRLFQLSHARHENTYIGKEQLYDVIRSSEDQVFGYLELDTVSGKTSLGKKLMKFRERELSGITLKINDSDKYRLRYAFVALGEEAYPQTSQTSQTSADPGGENELFGDPIHGSHGSSDNGPSNGGGTRGDVCEVCEVSAEVGTSWILVETAEQVSQLLLSLPYTSAPLAIDLETYGGGKSDALDPWKGHIRLIQLAFEDSPPYIVDVRAVGEAIHGLLDRLKDHLLVGHNLSFDLAYLGRHFGFRANAVFCTMTASKVLSAGDVNSKHSLGTVLQRFLDLTLQKELGKSDWSGSLSDEQLAYATLDVAHLLRLREVLKDRLEESALTRTAQLEMKMVIVAVEMRLDGLCIDSDSLGKLKAEVGARQEFLKAQITSIAGPDLNPQSTPQLKKAFLELGVELLDTKEETLADCDHDLARAILGFRKAKGGITKADELLRLTADDGRVHSDFDPMGTRTGRFSASKPNVQNLPRGIMRGAIVAGEGRKLIAADYSQIELRVAAVLAGEEQMLAAYRSGEDLHTKTASLILGKPTENVSGEERRLAKAVNFGLLYGQSAKGLVGYAENTYNVSLTLEDAVKFREAFFRAYPALYRWHERMRREANDGTEEARTRIGRRRIIPWNTDWWPRFTTLVNTPVQGTASDGMKLALWEMRENLPDSAKLVSMIHDEVIIEVDEHDADEVVGLVKRLMIEAMSKLLPEVPIEVDAKVGKTWGGDEGNTGELPQI